MDIQDKIFLIVGGGVIAYRKLEVLSQFNTNIVVVAPKICENIYHLQQSMGELNKNGKTKITCRNREYEQKDIMNVDFVIAATNDEALNSSISKLCKDNNILVNVVDVKEECSFVFPAIVKEKDLVVSISTGGNSPAMAAKIKEDIQATIPGYYGDLIETLGEYRDYIKNQVINPKHRKLIYNEAILLAEQKQENLTKDEMIHIIKRIQGR
jgi:siroheme synthase-like protein